MHNNHPNFANLSEDTISSIKNLEREIAKNGENVILLAYDTK